MGYGSYIGTDPDNLFTYDPVGRLKSIGSSFSYDYSFDMISAIHRQNGAHELLETRTYEPHRDILTNLSYTANGYTFSHQAQFDGFGRMEKAWKTKQIGTIPTDEAYVYSYNSRNELTGVDMPGRAHTQSYQYDAIGNRTTFEEVKAAESKLKEYQANELNQYTQIDDGAATTTPTYDADGNMTNDTRFVYVFNTENQLIEAKPADPANAQHLARLEMAYDYAGRRISKKVYHGQQGNWTLEKTHRFHYDGWNLIKEEINGGPVRLREYIWGLDVSGSLQGAGGVCGLLAIMVDGVRYDVLHDLQGNVISVLDPDAAAEVCSHTYDPFGRLLEGSRPRLDICPFLYSTRYYDEETGLYYYGYRYLSPAQGHWINRDPIEEDGGLNIYGFVRNNPIKYIDLLGLTG